MKILEPIFIEVIEKLLQCNVDFILIGGYAVNYYGYGRYTGDIDFWLRNSEENKTNFLSALAQMNKDKGDIEELKNLDFNIAQVISIGQPPLKIDFLTKVNLVNFEDAWQKRNYFRLKTIQVPVVDYHHLILTKFNTGRPKDKLDLDELQKINQLKNNK